jgi:hypothetical protein
VTTDYIEDYRPQTPLSRPNGENKKSDPELVALREPNHSAFGRTLHEFTVNFLPKLLPLLRKMQIDDVDAPFVEEEWIGKGKKYDWAKAPKQAKFLATEGVV